MSQRNVLKLVTAVAVMLATGISATGQENRDTKEATKRLERLLVAAQGICPVMGKDLTKMGGPVKARVDKQTIFLCCKGCFKGKIKKGHWDQIQKNLIAAQGKCPVMGNPLPDKPASIVVSGRKVFVCCPPCTKEIESAPQKYIAVVDVMLERNVGHQSSNSLGHNVPSPADHQAAAKKQIYTCPMHPEIQWSRPDNCPICNMKLVAKGVDAPPVTQGMADHAGMTGEAQEAPHSHNGMGAMMMGCGCPMCTEMMGMGGTNGEPARTVSPASRSGRAMYRAYAPRGGAGRCGC